MYKREQAFPIYSYIKNKYCNTLNINADLRVSISSKKHNLDEIINEKKFNSFYEVRKSMQN